MRERRSFFFVFHFFCDRNIKETKYSAGSCAKIWGMLSNWTRLSYVSMILVARVSLTNPMCLTWYVFFFLNLIWVTQLRYPFQFIRKSRSKTEISAGNFWWVIGDCINLATEIVLRARCTLWNDVCWSNGAGWRRGFSSSTKQWMSGAAAAPDDPHYWGSLSRLFSGTFLKTLKTTILHWLVPSMNTSNLS
jgi:hypothetical protein